MQLIMLEIIGHTKNKNRRAPGNGGLFRYGGRDRSGCGGKCNLGSERAKRGGAWGVTSAIVTVEEWGRAVVMIRAGIVYGVVKGR